MLCSGLSCGYVLGLLSLPPFRTQTYVFLCVAERGRLYDCVKLCQKVQRHTEVRLPPKSGTEARVPGHRPAGYQVSSRSIRCHHLLTSLVNRYRVHQS